MTCREFADFLMEYLDGNLPAAEHALFEEHLAECPDCVAYLATYRETIRLGKALCAQENEALSPEVPNELVQAILAVRPGVTASAPEAPKHKKNPQSKSS